MADKISLFLMSINFNLNLSRSGVSINIDSINSFSTSTMGRSVLYKEIVRIFNLQLNNLSSVGAIQLISPFERK